jgi:hypothetical protein
MDCDPEHLHIVDSVTKFSVSVEGIASLLEERCMLGLDYLPATEYVPPEHRPQLDAPAHSIQTEHRLGPDIVSGQLQLFSMCQPYSSWKEYKGKCRLC